MRDADHLVLARERDEPFAHAACGLTAETRVDLVEEQEPPAIRVAQRVAKRQQQTRKLAARGRIAQPARRLARIRREPERSALAARRSGRRSEPYGRLRLEGLEHHAERRTPQLERTQLGGDRALERGRGFAARAGERAARPVERVGGGGELALELGRARFAALEARELGGRALAVREDLLDRVAVARLQPPQCAEPLLDLGEPARVGLEARRVALEQERRLVELEPRTLERGVGLGERRVELDDTAQ